MNVVHVHACMHMCVCVLRVCYECVHSCAWICVHVHVHVCVCVVDVYFSSVVCVLCSCSTGCVHMLTLRGSL